MKRFLPFLFTLLIPALAQAAPILVWGDSLSAGFGIPQETAWPSLLRQKLSREGYRYAVVNASISGETTAGGLARLPEALARHKPEIVIIELGANDGLRGQPLVLMRNNLASMIKAAQATKARVLLLGMRLPPNLGPAYTQKFHASFGELARDYKTRLVPFFLEAVAPRRELFQADTIHPVAEAQQLILDTVWVELKPLLHK